MFHSVYNIFMNDIIVAISTNSINSAISIVRISGDHSRDLIDRIFVSKNKLENRVMTYGHIVDPATGTVMDEVMVVFLASPKTYTREDMVEINCHGGSVSARRILELILRNGARLANRGEFTLRAFLNGRIDLTQAESVADLVGAKTVKAFDCSLNQLEGAMSAKVGQIVASLIEVIAGITVSIDYPEEDVEDVSWQVIRDGIKKAISEIGSLLKNAEHSRLITEGAKIAIVGRPNVGKSSLMNMILGESRAIVTDIPGTTRDTIEEVISIDGYPIRLIDTAGLRDTNDPVEKIGIEKTKNAANIADVIILILDVSRPLNEEDTELLSHFSARNLIIIANKNDLGNAWGSGVIPENLRDAVIFTTLKNDPEGAKISVECAVKHILKRGMDSDEVMINARHQDLLRQSLKILEDAQDLSEYDLVEVDLREVVNLLGNITGKSVGDDILHAIFSKFCLGK